MIHSFSASNFFCFKDAVDISFKVGTSAPKTNQFFTSETGQRLTKAQVLIGPNGSGKTNLLKGLPFLRHFMLSSFSQLEPEDPILVDCFFSGELHPLCLCMEFEEAGSLYKYELILDELNNSENGVVREVLSKKHEKSYQYLYKRTFHEGSYKIVLKDLDVNLKDIQAFGQRKNASLFSVLRHIETPEITEISHGLEKFHSNVDFIGKIDTEAAKYLSNVSARYAKDEELKYFAESILSGLDLGLSGFRIEEYDSIDETDQKEKRFYPVGLHLVKGKEISLPFFLESSGTKKLFVLLSRIIPVLFSGGIAVIDELGADLHPHMLPRILDLFFNPDTNPNNAQLLFSCHAPEVLKRLDKTQIVLVEKDAETCESEACRLDQLRGVRRDDNFYVKYMSGIYGAVPNI